MEENSLIIYEMLHEYVRSAHIGDIVAKELRKTSSSYERLFHSFNNQFGQYYRFFDAVFFWSETKPGYTFWAYHQLRFYYCLWKAGLVRNVGFLNTLRGRLYNADGYGNDEHVKLIKLVDKELFRNGERQR